MLRPIPQRGAWAIDTGYTFADHPWKPRLSVNYVYGSGNGSPFNYSNSNFDIFYGFNQPFSRNDYFAWNNIKDPKVRIEFTPAKNLQIDSAFSAFLERARAELKPLSDPRQRLGRLAWLHLHAMGGNRPLAVVFQTELRHSAKFLAQFSQHQLVEYFDLIRSVVREGQTSGVFRREVSDKIAANCFFGALDEMVTSWMLSEHEYELAGAAEAVVDVILRGLDAGPGHGSAQPQHG